MARHYCQQFYYTIDNLPQIRAITGNREETLLLNWLPPLSFMSQTSYLIMTIEVSKS